MKAIEITGLSKTYRGKKGQRVEALKNLSLTVSAGEVFGFLGPNGSGKSTTIKTLVGQIKPTNGQAHIFEQPVTSPSARLKIGYLPENPAFYDYLTAREYLDLVGTCFNMAKADIARESARVLALLELTEAANRPIRGYSKGMVQRLGLAQTLLHDPDVYILDEPMSGLDPVGRALVKEIMLGLKAKGKTIFFSTHVIADVEAVCDRVAIVSAGTLQAVHSVYHVMQKGIEGYSVQVRGCPPETFPSFVVTKQGEEAFTVVVPQLQFQEFMQRLLAHNGHIEIIEPQRRSLEELFLATIGRAP